MADVTVKSLIGSVKNAYIGFLQPILGEFCGISNQKCGSHSLSDSLPYGWSVSA